jgi:membrane-associated protease RseP (regulator of RpoE activity)
METLDRDTLDPIVQRHFFVDSVTAGEVRSKPYLVYTGHFYSGDVEKTHTAMLEALKPYQLIPLFREEKGKPEILLAEKMVSTSKSRPLLNLVFFVITLFSVLLSGALYSMGGEETVTSNFWVDLLRNLGKGWPFALSLLGILAAHEFGHYLAGRYHKTDVTLPFFIPFPLSTFGTLGAFIQMKDLPKNRKHLLDIAIAGPLAGLVVTIPILMIGLSLSHVEPLPAILPQGQAFQLEGNSLLYLFLKWIVKGQLLPAPASFNGLPEVIFWIRYFFTGQPIPLGGMDVMLHPMAWAGWAGLLVTSLNLIPAGQLDGGHIFYVLFGSRGSRGILPLILVALVGLGFVWNGWWLWAVLIFFLGRAHAEPMDQITPLDSKRKWLGALTLLVFVLVFTPVPLIIVGM